MAAIKLQAPKGCTGLSFAGESYAISTSGTVDVPVEAVADLVGAHGFTVCPAAPEAAPEAAATPRGRKPRAAPEAAPDVVSAEEDVNADS